MRAILRYGFQAGAMLVMGFLLRLSAACLVMWEINAQAKTAENAEDGFTSFRVERIDQTGDKELHGRHESIVI